MSTTTPISPWFQVSAVALTWPSQGCLIRQLRQPGTITGSDVAEVYFLNLYLSELAVTRYTESSRYSAVTSFGKSFTVR